MTTPPIRSNLPPNIHHVEEHHPLYPLHGRQQSAVKAAGEKNLSNTANHHQANLPQYALATPEILETPETSVRLTHDDIQTNIQTSLKNVYQAYAELFNPNIASMDEKIKKFVENYETFWQNLEPVLISIRDKKIFIQRTF